MIDMDIARIKPMNDEIFDLNDWINEGYINS